MKELQTFSVCDLLGISASALCAVHCVAMPFLFAFLAVMASWLPGDETLHQVLAFAVAGCAVVAFLAGFRKHGRVTVLALMVAGVSIIFFTSFFACEWLPSCAWETPLMILGSAFMITAHWRNVTFCRSCGNCMDREEGDSLSRAMQH